jgi:hypothetical protein
MFPFNGNLIGGFAKLFTYKPERYGAPFPLEPK